MEDKTIIDTLIELITIWGIKVLAALLILVIGLWIAKKLKAVLTSVLEKKEVDPTLIGFFANLLYGGVVVFVVIAAIGKLGVETTSFAAVIAAAGLAIGLALQGSLSNFASGVLIILFKPFQAGNFIKAGGEAGIVVEVGILTTELKTPDNVKIIMPNAAIMSGAITNVSAHPTRRVDMVVGVGYGDDVNKAKTIIEGIIAADDRILKDPEPQVAVSNLGDSSVDFVVRPWVNAADYWAVKFDFTKAVKEKFDAEGISIPFPQRDVHLFQETSS
ncbi:MAG: mechanosensitive ion channel domain-containing protein [Verrucomicrobiota bacterium]